MRHLLPGLLILGLAGLLLADEPRPRPKDAQPPPVFTTQTVRFERVATGYRFTEGPAADATGNVFFTDIPNERILRLDIKTGKVSVFREESGRANGLQVDAEGRLVACEGGRRRLVRIGSKKTEILAERFGTKRLNSPNDVTLDQAGGIWFTDPRYGKQDDRELDVMAVYYLPPGGKLRQVIADLPRPNGIILSADAKTLYVAANRRKLIMAYDVAKPGTVANGRVFARLDPDGRGGPDGLSLDERGNLYCAGQGHVWIWSSSGKRLHKLKVPESPTNVTFGGAERRTLYVTARTSLYRVETGVRGASAVSAGPRRKPRSPKAPAR
ncbi:MAG: SMP-30/gluconolactonase/LRE family protein [Planctomycetota bacterium]|nr:SMP-30/gluconolactonase/LRE family protein [Planctomycetota bacterium]